MNAEYTGKKILTLRKKKGWTQKELAKQIHVTDKAVSKWERGLNYPDVSLLETLGKVLGTTVTDLLGLEDSSDKSLLGAVSLISQEDKNKLKREFRNRTWLNIIVGVIIFVSEIYLSKILSDNLLYSMPQVLTVGMCGMLGGLIGNGLYMLRKYRKL